MTSRLPSFSLRLTRLEPVEMVTDIGTWPVLPVAYAERAAPNSAGIPKASSASTTRDSRVFRGIGLPVMALGIALAYTPYPSLTSFPLLIISFMARLTRLGLPNSAKSARKKTSRLLRPTDRAIRV